MQTDNNSIHFIITGGTIDSHYDGIKDTVVPNTQSVIPNFINTLNLNEEVIKIISEGRFTSIFEQSK